MFRYDCCYLVWKQVQADAVPDIKVFLPGAMWVSVDTGVLAAKARCVFRPNQSVLNFSHLDWEVQKVCDIQLFLSDHFE